MEDELICSIDETIETVCTQIKRTSMINDNYAYTIKALACLVEARAKI